MQKLREMIKRFSVLNERQANLDSYSKIGKELFKEKNMRMDIGMFLSMVLLFSIFYDNYFNFIGTISYDFISGTSGFNDRYSFLMALTASFFWVGFYKVLKSTILFFCQNNNYKKQYTKENQEYLIQCHREYKERNKDIKQSFFDLMNEFEEYSKHNDVEEMTSALFTKEQKVVEHLKKCISNHKQNTKNKHQKA